MLGTVYVPAAGRGRFGLEDPLASLSGWDGSAPRWLSRTCDVDVDPVRCDGKSGAPVLGAEVRVEVPDLV